MSISRDSKDERNGTGLNIKQLAIVVCVFVFIISGTLACVLVCEKDDFIPTAYDIRDHDLMTPVRDQNGKKADGTSDIGSTVGLCWAFASLASLESSMLKQGMTTDPLSPEASLSPWYMGNNIGFNHPYYEFNAETIPDLKPSTTLGYFAPGYGWGGGGSFWTADYLIGGKELPTWNDCPMPTEDQTSHLALTSPSTQQTKGYNIAQMSLIFADDFNDVSEYRDHIKRYIMDNGAIQSMVHLEPIDIQGMTSQIVNGIEYFGYRFMDKENFNLYTYEIENHSTALYTHAVAIAGWDDNRMIDVGGHTTTGAWLVKDSEGETSWDEGYFWVAYDDLAINTIASGLIACPEGSYEHQSKYQTHPGILSNISGIDHLNEESCLDMGEFGYLSNGFETGTSWGFTEFNLSSDEILAAVGVFSSNVDQKVTVEVYKNNIENEPIVTKQFNLDDIGYHLLELGTELDFFSSDTMIIGVGYEQSFEHDRLPLPYVQDNEFDFTYPTYFGIQDDGEFQLTPYSDIGPNCSFFIQAIVMDSGST